jgi:hypothetical protein
MKIQTLRVCLKSHWKDPKGFRQILGHPSLLCRKALCFGINLVKTFRVLGCETRTYAFTGPEYTSSID